MNMTTNNVNDQLPPTPLSLNRIFQLWWPLTAAWGIMMFEMVVITAVIARMSAPETNLAAWGISQPITMILTAMIIPIISASAALSKDWVSYLRVRSYLLTMSITLTLVHFLIAFTPLYDWFIVPLIGIPTEVIEPTRWGLYLLLPYALSMGIRRLHHGVLIRFGHSEVMLYGTFIRLGIITLVLALTLLTDNISSIIFATASTSLGVIVEMVYVAWKVRPIINDQLKKIPPVDEPMRISAFVPFYLPLVAMSVLYMTLQPLISSGLTRMPNPVDSLAVWPVLRSLLILMSSGGFACIEVVVVLLDEPQAMRSLRRFTLYLSAVTTAVMLVMSATPLAQWWFQSLVSLPPALVPMAKQGLWILTLVPGLFAIQHWLQGILINNRDTRGIMEAFIFSLMGTVLTLLFGVYWGGMSGINVGMFAYLTGDLIRAGWLWHRAHPIIKASNLKQRALQYV